MTAKRLVIVGAAVVLLFVGFVLTFNPHARCTATLGRWDTDPPGVALSAFGPEQGRCVY